MDPPENPLQLEMSKKKISTIFLIIGNYREYKIKTGQKNKQSNFHNLTDP